MIDISQGALLVLAFVLLLAGMIRAAQIEARITTLERERGKAEKTDGYFSEM